MIFRGLSDKDYKLESGAYRRIKNSLRVTRYMEGYTQAISNSNVGNYIAVNLIEEVKKRQWHRHDGRALEDLEILAHLQHQGAATPLMDWSRSFAVALWFACEENKDERNEDKDGRVVMMNILANSDKTITAITSENRDLDYDNLNEDKVYYFEPASTLERIVSQSSVFLFSKTEPLALDIKEVFIPHDKKKKLKEEIFLFFNTNEASLFNDFVGFATRNKHSDKLTPDEIIEVTTKVINLAGGNNETR